MHRPTAAGGGAIVDDAQRTLREVMAMPRASAQVEGMEAVDDFLRPVRFYTPYRGGAPPDSSGMSPQRPQWLAPAAPAAAIEEPPPVHAAPPCKSFSPRQRGAAAAAPQPPAPESVHSSYAAEGTVSQYLTLPIPSLLEGEGRSYSPPPSPVLARAAHPPSLAGSSQGTPAHHPGATPADRSWDLMQRIDEVTRRAQASLPPRDAQAEPSWASVLSSGQLKKHSTEVPPAPPKSDAGSGQGSEPARSTSYDTRDAALRNLASLQSTAEHLCRSTVRHADAALMSTGGSLSPSLSPRARLAATSTSPPQPSAPAASSCGSDVQSMVSAIKGAVASFQDTLVSIQNPSHSPLLAAQQQPLVGAAARPAAFQTAPPQLQLHLSGGTEYPAADSYAGTPAPSQQASPRRGTVPSLPRSPSARREEVPLSSIESVLRQKISAGEVDVGELMTRLCATMPTAAPPQLRPTQPPAHSVPLSFEPTRPDKASRRPDDASRRQPAQRSPRRTRTPRGGSSRSSKKHAMNEMKQALDAHRQRASALVHACSEERSQVRSHLPPGPRTIPLSGDLPSGRSEMAPHFAPSSYGLRRH